MKKDNIWLPWTPTRSIPAQSENREQVLAIVPTAGTQPQRLSRCLRSLREAAGAGIALRTLVILCPATPESLKSTRTVCRGMAQVVPLDGRFNYCHSINSGLLHRVRGDRMALFLNDDVTFTEPDTLLRMARTLREQRWACVGPHISEWHEHHSSVARQRGAIRTNEPVNGCCALWDLAWIDRIGGLDEGFGLGWGLDEADACLRALRKGAHFGREDRVRVEHQGHATFGARYTTLDGPAHRRNLRLFQKKHGQDVGPWGQTHHWWPMPSIQVSMATHNASRWLERTLKSVERSMDGFRWLLVAGDDASTDESYEILAAQTRSSSADAVVIRRFKSKAMTVDQAKNRVLRMGAALSHRYPAMCLMDADDEMLPGRVQHLLWRARDGGHAAVLGDYLQIAPQYPAQHRQVIHATEEAQITTGFGPWATLFHASLIPASSKLFREHREQVSHGDVELWARWFRRGIFFEPFPGELVHRYYWHKGTASRPSNPKIARRADAMWMRRKSRLLGVNLFDDSAIATYSQPPARVNAVGRSPRLLREDALRARAYSQPVVVARSAVARTLKIHARRLSVRAYSQPPLVMA